MSEGRTPSRHFETYIGDGAYVYMNDAAQIILYTSNGLTETNRIALESQVLTAFEDWIDELGARMEDVRP